MCVRGGFGCFSVVLKSRSWRFEDPWAFLYGESGIFVPGSSLFPVAVEGRHFSTLETLEVDPWNQATPIVRSRTAEITHHHPLKTENTRQGGDRRYEKCTRYWI
ncbi:unnamed protein product [Blepharisma stoltei]|uniref:Uncharacterized protein n=1 Tax=Blepharisma stoltei TaxID=1481888 RepID=A0AAU9JTT5_9CILI|nr:unnamed protein product [Blepharisma stoltei]